MGIRAVWMLLGIAALLGAQATAQAAAQISIPAKTCDVTRYGASGSGQPIMPQTEVFQKAIDDCAATGGGTVEVPAGNYMTGPLFLKSNIRLHLARNAVLLATGDEASFRITPEMTQYGAENGWLPFISVSNAENVEISGDGIVDGQGAIWWDRWRANVRANPSRRGATDRPRLIYVKSSRNVLIEGLTLTNSPSFHVVLRYSENVDVTHTRIISPWHAPNTDAIDPIDSRNVRITYNYIDCNDDHVAIKAEKFDPRYPEGVVSNIYIAHNTLLQGRGISIGSESAGGVHGVLVEHNTFEGSMYGLRIKSPRGKGGRVYDVVYRDITMKDVGVPLVFSGYYQGAPAAKEDLDKRLAEGGFLVGDQIYPPENDPAQAFDVVKTPSFSKVRIENLVSTGQSKSAGYVIGVPEAVFSDFVFDRVRIDADAGLLVRNAALSVKDLVIKAKTGAALVLQKDGKVTKN